MNWILLSFVYAITVAVLDLSKKLALKKSNTFAILAISTTVSVVCLLWSLPTTLQLDFSFLPIIILKSFIVALLWIFLQLGLKRLDVSKTSLLTNFSLIITFIGGIVIFNESFTILKVIGLAIVLVGIVLISLVSNNQGSFNVSGVIFVLVSAVLSGMSSMIDKYASTKVMPIQLLFWYLLFCMLFMWIASSIISLVKKEPIVKKADFKNVYNYLAGIALAGGDLCLFTACSIVGSEISIITIIAKFNVVIITVLGMIIFKESNKLKKSLILLTIFTGIILSAI